MTTAQLLALRSELDTDPNAYGYAADVAAGRDQALADALNVVRAGAGGTGPSQTVRRGSVSPLEVLEAVRLTDFIASGSQTLLQAAWFESLTQFAAIRILKDDGTDTRTMTNLLGLLTNASASETRVRALAVRFGSRAELLFGEGTRIGALDVAQAYGRGL